MCLVGMARGQGWSPGHGRVVQAPRSLPRDQGAWPHLAPRANLAILAPSVWVGRVPCVPSHPPQGGRTQRAGRQAGATLPAPHPCPRAWRPGWRAERGPPPRAPVPWHRVPPFLGAEALGGLAGPGGHPSSPPSTQAAAQVPHAFQQLHEDRAASVRPGARVLGASQGWGSGKSPGACGCLLF